MIFPWAVRSLFQNDERWDYWEDGSSSLLYEGLKFFIQGQGHRLSVDWPPLWIRIRAAGDRRFCIWDKERFDPEDNKITA